jgi:putative holliday junction resolvase
MLKEGRILGIDYGSRRVGVAITDPARSVIFPREILRNNEFLIADLIQMCAEESVLTVVFGVPLKIDGTDTKQSKEIRVFAEKFEKESGLQVEYQDEAYTTFEAERMIGERKHLEKDSFSAMKILEQYLQKLKN